MNNVIKTIYTLPPRTVIRKFRQKLLGNSSHVFCLEDIVGSPKHMRAQRGFDFLNRYQSILKRHLKWEELNFKGKHVLEIGSGPLLGWAPLSILMGCQSYTCVEPMFNPAVLGSDIIVEKYFLPLYKDINALYDSGISFKQFIDSLKKRVNIEKKELLEAQLSNSFDITLSNSCLEHIFHLHKNLAKLKSMSSLNNRFLHLVDLGNHRGTRNPFEGMYTTNPEAYYSKYGKNINLLRASDIQGLFDKAGFKTSMTLYYSFKDLYNEKISPYWSGQYKEEELFMKTVIITEQTESKGL